MTGIVKFKDVDNAISLITKRNNNHGMQVSLYSGECTELVQRACFIKLRQAFPSLEPNFFIILKERIDNKEISDKRLIDAIDNIIDTCKYPTPTIAGIIDFDINVNLYTYNQIINSSNNGTIGYKKLKKGSHWVTEEDAELFNLEVKENK